MTFLIDENLSFRRGGAKHFGGVGADTALGLTLRCDHGSNYMSQDFQNEIGFMGIAGLPAIVAPARGQRRCLSRPSERLNEQLLRVRRFATVEELAPCMG